MLKVSNRTIDQKYAVEPTDPEWLWKWIRQRTGVRLARRSVCANHQSTFSAFVSLYFNEPDESLWLGSRGSGKSFMAGLHSHLRSRFHPRHGTRILGGSKAQSRQVYNGLLECVIDGKGTDGINDADTIRTLGVEQAKYRNGSTISILAASTLSVRGPHVPDLKLDEVDEIPTDLREAAYGMAMQKPGGRKSTILLTSTWHNVGGPMGGLVEKANALNADKPGTYPFFTFCLFEVLERCPESWSGKWVGGATAYENCPVCPLQSYCHADRDSHRGLPRAKRSDGHYTIPSTVQKIAGVSRRTFESDYLCMGPKSEGLVFPEFDPTLNVSESAEFDPTLDVHCAVDSGAWSGAVFFQVHRWWDVSARVERQEIYVIGEYLTDVPGAERVASDVREVARSRFADRIDIGSTDQAGDARNAIGPKVVDIYEQNGLPHLKRWPKYPGSVADGIALIDSFVKSADGTRSLFIHPSCRRTIEAFRNYRRKKRAGQWETEPEDPQHPHEEMIDSLRGGLMVAFPTGRGGDGLRLSAPAHVFS